MRRTPTAVLVCLILATTGCGSAEPASQSTPQQTPAVKAAPPRAATTPVDAATVVKKIKAAGIKLTSTATQDENTDPNNLLGRPNGYVSRASGDLADGNFQADRYSVDRGLVVEVFADADAARNRSEFILGALKAAPLLGSEWHYTTDEGRALVRVTGELKPSAAKKIESVVKAM